MIANVKVGDVIHTSWGYSMTLHDFYRIEKLTPKTAVVQLMKKEVLGGGMGALLVKPTDEVDRCHSFGEPQRVKIRGLDKKPYVFIRGCQLAYLEPYDPNREYLENHMD